jgi:hypothetical protein
LAHQRPEGVMAKSSAKVSTDARPFPETAFSLRTGNHCSGVAFFMCYINALRGLLDSLFCAEQGIFCALTLDLLDPSRTRSAGPTNTTGSIQMRDSFLYQW